jgi:hypothetical protein
VTAAESAVGGERRVGVDRELAPLDEAIRQREAAVRVVTRPSREEVAVGRECQHQDGKAGAPLQGQLRLDRDLAGAPRYGHRFRNEAILPGILYSRAVPDPSRVCHVALGLTIFAVAALMRSLRLGETPGWDGDEGYNLEIAWQFLQGRAQAYAVSQSFVQHPVLFYALLATLLGAFGRELWVARALTATAGALTGLLIYLSVARGMGARPAVFAGVAFAVAPFFVLHNRLAYTYNLLLLWSAVVLLCVTEWEDSGRPRWLVGACAAAALGLLTDQVGIALPLFVAARVLPDRRRAVRVLLAGVAPAIVFALVMLLIAPEAALQDWRQSFLRVGGDPAVTGDGAIGSPGVRLATWFVNYLHLLRAEWWWPAAVAGLFCVQPLRARQRVLALAGLMVVPTFALREIEPFFRTAIPLLLPGAIGLGALLHAGMSAVYRTVPVRLPAAGVAALVVALPLGLELARSAGSVATRFQTRFDWALVHDEVAARRAAAHVNVRVQEADVVIVSPHVSWLYAGRVTDFFQSAAWEGDPVAFYPAGTLRSRFAFDPSVEGATYVVLDGFWERWAEASPPVARLLERVRDWPEEVREGEFSVRRNPRDAALRSSGRPATTK